MARISADDTVGAALLGRSQNRRVGVVDAGFRGAHLGSRRILDDFRKGAFEKISKEGKQLRPHTTNGITHFAEHLAGNHDQYATLRVLCENQAGRTIGMVDPGKQDVSVYERAGFSRRHYASERGAREPVGSVSGAGLRLCRTEQMLAGSLAMHASRHPS